MTKDFDAGELKLVPFSSRLDVMTDQMDVDFHAGVIVECIDALPDLKNNLIAVNPSHKHKPEPFLPQPVSIPYWYVEALHSAASINLSTKKETITIQIGDTKHLFKVQLLSNKCALKKGEELIKMMPEKDKPQQIEIEPATKKAKVQLFQKQ